MNFLDNSIDERVREALREADKSGDLDTVAAIIGIAGGVDELRQIMNSTGELNIMDRGMIAMHLGV